MEKSQNKIIKLFDNSIKLKQKVMQTNASEKVEEMANLIIYAIKNNNKLLLCGNGGSASDAEHLATELIVRLRANINRKAISAISLTINTSAITACSNDFSFDNIFERALESLGQKGDVLLGISTSGNSINVKKALIKAKDMGIKTCSFLGSDGGDIRGIADCEYIVPSNETGRVQEVHIMLGHALMETIENKLIDDKYI